MKRKACVLILGVMIMIFFSSCSGNKINPDIAKTGLDKINIQRLVVVNNRSSQNYMIMDENGKNRFKNAILKAVSVKKSSNLEPDFTFEFYSATKSIASFKYIAGITDSSVANLIGKDGELYHVDDSVEDQFYKRMIQTAQNNNVTKYYIALINKIMEKISPKPGDTVVVDIRKDYVVTSSLISVNQKSIIDSISNGKINVVYPGEASKWDYYITINTTYFSNHTNEAKANVSVKDKDNVTVNFEIERTYNGDFFIKFK